MSIRPIKRIIQAQPAIEGAGVHLRRAFGFGETSDFDPFLLFDDFRNDRPDDYIAGFPWHPHRGIETITYVLDGDVEHKDSLGNSGVIRSGDVQWMTAGSGIIHQEMPQGNAKGQMWGFQLWANLPKQQKMMDPRYREITSGQIPSVKTAEGATVRVICGEVTSLAPALRSRHVWQSFRYPSPLTQPREFRDAIRDIVVRSRPDVMIVGECSTLAALGPIRDELSESLHLVAPSPRWERLFGDKRELAGFARDRGVTVPRTVSFADGDDAERLLPDFPFPSRFKPARGEGSVGQKMFRDRAEFFAFRAQDRPAGVLQEELPPPRAKVGLGLLVADGDVLASFAYRKDRELHASGGASTMRVSIDDTSYRGVVESLISKTGYSGFLHLELFVTEHGTEPILNEANPRPWG